MNSQQDAHDFFTFLIDGLNTETNRGDLFAEVAKLGTVMYYVFQTFYYEFSHKHLSYVVSNI